MACASLVGYLLTWLAPATCCVRERGLLIFFDSVTDVGWHVLLRLSLLLANTRVMDCLWFWLAQDVWVIWHYGLLNIYGLSASVACSRAMSCLHSWLSRKTWVVQIGGLLSTHGLSYQLACYHFLGCRSPGLLPVVGLSALLACSYRVGCHMTWLARLGWVVCGRGLH